MRRGVSKEAQKQKQKISTGGVSIWEKGRDRGARRKLKQIESNDEAVQTIRQSCANGGRGGL